MRLLIAGLLVRVQSGEQSRRSAAFSATADRVSHEKPLTLLSIVGLCGALGGGGVALDPRESPGCCARPHKVGQVRYPADFAGRSGVRVKSAGVACDDCRVIFGL